MCHLSQSVPEEVEGWRKRAKVTVEKGREDGGAVVIVVMVVFVVR